MGEIVGEIGSPEDPFEGILRSAEKHPSYPVRGFGSYFKPGDQRRAQQAFREALLAVAPEVLREFCDLLLPLYDEWRSVPGRRWCDNPEEYRGPSLREDTAWFGPAISEWAKKHRLNYDWVTDFALAEVAASWPPEDDPGHPHEFGKYFIQPDDAHALKLLIGGRLLVGEVERGRFHEVCSDALAEDINQTDVAPQIPALVVPVWDPLAGTWEQFTKHVTGLLPDYRVAVESAMESSGFKKRRVKRTLEHFEWLVERVVFRKSWNQIGQRYNADPNREIVSGATRFQRAVMETAEECGVDLAHVSGRQERNPLP